MGNHDLIALGTLASVVTLLSGIQAWRTGNPNWGILATASGTAAVILFGTPGSGNSRSLPG